MTDVPHNPLVEEALLGRLLRDPGQIADASATLLEPAHFYTAAHRLIYGALLESFYADEPVDPLVVGELHAKQLSKLWQVDEPTAVERVVALPAKIQLGSTVQQTAGLIKRDHDYRQLLRLAEDIRDRVAAEKQSPEEIAGVTGQAAMAVATSAVMMSQEIVPFGDVGRHFVRDIQIRQAAREQGVELGAYFGLKAIDTATSGLQPSC
jgi:replicative DNA helicase